MVIICYDGLKRFAHFVGSDTQESQDRTYYMLVDAGYSGSSDMCSSLLIMKYEQWLQAPLSTTTVVHEPPLMGYINIPPE